MKYFLDTEFHEYKKQPKVLGIKAGKPIDTIELISIGIVSEDTPLKKSPYKTKHGQEIYEKMTVKGIGDKHVGESEVFFKNNVWQPFDYLQDFDGNNFEITNNHINIQSNSREYYAICKDFDLKAAWDNEWLRDNVLKPIWTELRIDDYEEPKRKDNARTIAIYTGAYGRKMLITSLLQDSWFTYKDFKRLINKYGKTREQIAEEVKEFTVQQLHIVNTDYIAPIEFYAYYAAYDWVVFCWLFGRMIDLPTGFPMYCNDLKQILDEKAKTLSGKIDTPNDRIVGYNNLKEQLEYIKQHVNYPKQDNEHNALDDAKWDKELDNFITSVY